MRKEEKEQLFKQIENLQSQGDQIYRALMGDELNQYPGLIAEQKQDNEFRDFVKKTLTDITTNQSKQFKINTEVHERLEAVEVFMKFFTTLGKVKKTTLMIIGGLMAGFGWTIMNIERVWHWIALKLS